MKRIIGFIFVILLCLNANADENNEEYVAFVFTGMDDQNSGIDNKPDYNWIIETNSTTFIKTYFSGNKAGLLHLISKHKDGVYSFTKVGSNLFGDAIEIKSSKNNFDFVLQVAAKTVSNIYISYNYEKNYYIPSEGLLDNVISHVIYSNTIESNYALTIYAYKYADVYEQCKYFNDYSDMPKDILDEYFSKEKSK